MGAFRHLHKLRQVEPACTKSLLYSVLSYSAVRRVMMNHNNAMSCLDRGLSTN